MSLVLVIHFQKEYSVDLRLKQLWQLYAMISSKKSMAIKNLFHDPGLLKSTSHQTFLISDPMIKKA